MQAEIRREILDLPKVELHRHLSGSIRFNTLIELAKKHGQALPTYDVKDIANVLQSYGRTANLKQFLAAWRIINAVTVRAALQEPEIYSRLVYEAIEDAYLRENIQYLELRLVPPCLVVGHTFHVRAFKKALVALTDGISNARRKYPTLVKIIFSLPRDFLAKQTEKFLAFYYDILLKVVAKHKTDYVVGFDLSGNETKAPASAFSAFFKKAREQGYKITVHAGESDGPESVREAASILRVDRIGHAASAIQDEELVEDLRDSQIPIEICVTSNIATGAVKALHEHPVRKYFHSGLNLTINADDPIILRTDMNKECGLLMDKFGFSIWDIAGFMRNGLEAGFCTEEEKERLRMVFRSTNGRRPEQLTFFGNPD